MVFGADGRFTLARLGQVMVCAASGDGGRLYLGL